jgi:hypothetical protein
MLDPRPLPALSTSLNTPTRWRLLQSEGDRRAVFDEFCKNIASQQKELAAAAERQAVDGFK